MKHYYIDSRKAIGALVFNTDLLLIVWQKVLNGNKTI